MHQSFFFKIKKKKTKKNYLSNPDVLTGSTCETVDEISSTESLHFDFPTIRVATDNFSDANKLGQGGFGVVYKVIWQFHMVKYINCLP